MNIFLNLLGSASTAGEGGVLESVMTFLPIVVIIAVFYFMLIRPQQKKDKEDRAMRENLEIGDEIATIGGIVGIVVSVKEDTVVIETGSDRSKIRILKTAVGQLREKAN